MAYSFKVILRNQVEAYANLRAALDRDGAQGLLWLSVFDNWCHRNYPDANEVSQGMVDAWCSKRPTEKNSSTISRVYPILTFLRYLRERGLPDVQDPILPRAERSTCIPHAFTEAEPSSFFDACDSYPIHQSSTRSINLKLAISVFFRLLYSSGVRTTEARLLKRENADLDIGILDIRESKGHSQHFVAMRESMVALTRWYDESMERLYPGRAFFFPVNKEKGRPSAWVWQTFNKIWPKVSSVRATPYELRHHYAIANINQWIGLGFGFHDKLLYLSKSMGHASLESTKRYYALVPAMGEELIELTAPGFDEIIPEAGYE